MLRFYLKLVERGTVFNMVGKVIPHSGPLDLQSISSLIKTYSRNIKTVFISGVVLMGSVTTFYEAFEIRIGITVQRFIYV